MRVLLWCVFPLESRHTQRDRCNNYIQTPNSRIPIGKNNNFIIQHLSTTIYMYVLLERPGGTAERHRPRSLDRNPYLYVTVT